MVCQGFGCRLKTIAMGVSETMMTEFALIWRSIALEDGGEEHHRPGPRAALFCVGSGKWEANQMPAVGKRTTNNESSKMHCSFPALRYWLVGSRTSATIGFSGRLQLFCPRHAAIDGRLRAVVVRSCLAGQAADAATANCSRHPLSYSPSLPRSPAPLRAMDEGRSTAIEKPEGVWQTLDCGRGMTVHPLDSDTVAAATFVGR